VLSRTKALDVRTTCRGGCRVARSGASFRRRHSYRRSVCPSSTNDEHFIFSSFQEPPTSWKTSQGTVKLPWEKLVDDGCRNTRSSGRPLADDPLVVVLASSSWLGVLRPRHHTEPRPSPRSPDHKPSAAYRSRSGIAAFMT
jgi:hypothetical protein